MPTYNDYDLNMINDRIKPVVHVKQYDNNNRVIRFTLYNGDEAYSVPASTVVTCRGLKKSGNAFSEACSYTGNVVSVVVTTQMSVVSGRVPCELRLTKGTTIIGSMNFFMDVEENPIEDAVIDDDELSTVEQIQQDVSAMQTDVSTLQEEVEGDAETASASGSIVTVTADKSPVISLTANITGSQDLNGYDHPWSAGGGKNLLNLSGRTAVTSGTNSNTAPRDFSDDYAYVGITMNNWFYPSNVSDFTITDESITLTTTMSGYGVGINVAVTAETEYTFSYDSEVAGTVAFGFYDTDGVYLSYKQTNNLSDFTFTTPSACANVMIVFRPSPNVSTTYSNPQLELGSTASDYEPYENVCPITAYDFVNVTRCGKNLFGDSVINGYVRLGFVKTGETYTATATRSDTTIATYCYVRRSNDGLTNVETVGQIIAGSQSSAITFTAESGYDYYVWCNSSYSNVATVQIEVGSSATEYEAYNGDTYSINLAGAGTVYNGTLDVTNGLLTVNSVMYYLDGVNLKLTGMFGATDSGTAFFRTLVTRNQTNPPISNRFINSNLSYTLMPLFSMQGGSGATDTWTFVLPSSVTTVADANTWLSNNPVEIAYTYATPRTYYIDPTAITLLTGTNNVYADCGDITSLQYYSEYPALSAVDNLIDDVADIKNEADDGIIRVSYSGDSVPAITLPVSFNSTWLWVGYNAISLVYANGDVSIVGVRNLGGGSPTVTANTDDNTITIKGSAYQPFMLIPVRLK